MTVEAYLDHLLKLGMGWLGWTEAQTLDTSMPAIVLAYDGRIEMLQSIFGKGDAKADAKAEPAPEMGDNVVPLADRLKSALRSLKGDAAGGMRR